MSRFCRFRRNSTNLGEGPPRAHGSLDIQEGCIRAWLHYYLRDSLAGFSSQLFVDCDNKGAALGPDPSHGQGPRGSSQHAYSAARGGTSGDWTLGPELPGPSTRRWPVRSHGLLGKEGGPRCREGSKPTAGYQPGKAVPASHKAKANHSHQLRQGGVATPRVT